jgi:uncharacterized protein with beta-barrel porin domain
LSGNRCLRRSAGAGFTVFGASLQRDALSVDLGVDTKVNDSTSIFVRHDGEFMAAATTSRAPACGSSGRTGSRRALRHHGVI